jgi:hypothetical protein
VRLLYRFKDESKRDKVNSYVRVPNRHLSENSITARIDDLMPHIINMLEAEEDKMIKELHSKGQLNIYPESLSLDKLIESLEESGNAGRLNKEMIGKWFDEFISDFLTNAFAEKIGISLEQLEQSLEDPTEEDLEKLAKVERIVIAYKTKLESLASPKVSLNKEDSEALLNMFTKIPTALDNSVGRRLQSRINNTKDKEDILLSL